MLGIMYKQIKLIELFLVQSNAFRGLWLAVPLKIAIIFSLCFELFIFLLANLKHVENRRLQKLQKILRIEYRALSKS